MHLLIVLCTLFGVVFAEKCDEFGTWSVPTHSDGDCFQDGQYPSKDNWYCDWARNSGFYYNYYRCHPFVSRPAYYSSYLSSMPSAMYSMMAHTTAIINQCIDAMSYNGYGSDVNLQVSSWADICFMCPDSHSSYRYTNGYERTMSELSESSCKDIQRTFCRAVWPPYSSPGFTTLAPLPSSYNMVTRFLTFYTRNRNRLYDAPTGYYRNDLTPSFLHQFVSSLYSCQSTISGFIKIDCAVITSMFNALGYPQKDWRPYVGDEWASADSNYYCRSIDYIYRGYLQTIHKAIEYVSHQATCGSSSFFTSSDIPHGGSDDDDYDDGNDEGLSEWVIVVLGALGVVGVLGFCSLLFFLIYKIYTFTAPTTEARYSVVDRDEVIMNIPDGKEPPTPPPSYDNMTI